jgi:hypothetical protein
MEEPFCELCMVWQLLQGPDTFAAAGEKRTAPKSSAVRTTDIFKSFFFIASQPSCLPASRLPSPSSSQLKTAFP